MTQGEITLIILLGFIVLLLCYGIHVLTQKNKPPTIPTPQGHAERVYVVDGQGQAQPVQQPRSFPERAVRWLRKRAGWLLAITLVLLWPKLQDWLFAWQLQYMNGDVEAAAAASPWLPLGNPASKILLTLLVTSLGYGFMWGAMRLFHPTLHRWSKDDFKASFYALSDQWQLTLFAAFWLVSLLFFALIWVGASLVA